MDSKRKTLIIFYGGLQSNKNLEKKNYYGYLHHPYSVEFDPEKENLIHF